MPDNDVAVTYSTAFDPLVEVLSKVRRPGDFHATGVKETPMPSLMVEGVGVISFPVPATQAKEVIAVAGERAPYGKGEATLVDEGVRKAWQIGPDKIKLGGKGWTRCFGELVAQVATGLGCQDAEVSAEFYKLLVYEPGGFFLAHRDSEKTGGMFGTLVVVLPSAHEGGGLVIRHAGCEVMLDLGGLDPGEVHYAAFYADCEHQVKPIVSGHRLCLIYNLVQSLKPKQQVLVAPDHAEATAATANLLREWVQREKAPQKIAYLLDHHYTQAGLSFASLKNGDAALAQVLRAAVPLAGCALHLGIVHIDESGIADYSGNKGGYSRWHDDEEEEDVSEYEVGEVCDGEQYIGEWRDVHDAPVALGTIPLEDDELLPPGGLDGEEPDSLHFSEATGNAGAAFERTYLRAALVLWPLENFDAICLSAGMQAGLARLGQLVDEGLGSIGRPASLLAAQNLVRLLVDYWHRSGDQGSHLAVLMGHLARLGDADLIRQIFPELGGYNGRQNGSLVACSAVLGAASTTALYGPLLARQCPVNPATCLDLWLRLARQAPAGEEGTTMLKQIAAAFIPHLGRCSQESPRFSAAAAEGGDLPQLGPRLAMDFLQGLCALGDTRLLKQATAGMVENIFTFSPERILVPVLALAAKESRDVDISTIGNLWQHCAGFYLRRSEHAPAPPQDWAQSVAFSCNCDDCRALQSFARSPGERVQRFRMAKERRGHLHRQIEAAGLDMTHVTERTGSPHVLVCTKTRATYERALGVYKSDLTDMRLLSTLPAAGLPGCDALLQRLQAAAPHLPAA